MGRSTVDIYGAEKREDVLHFEPENLTLITDKGHSLYDPRVEFPVREELVVSIMRHGVLQPILVRKAGETKVGKAIVEVLAGRQRVKAAVEANKRLKKDGREPVTVPGRIKRGADQDLFGISVTENALRQGDDIMSSAKKAQRMRDLFSASDEDIAVEFGVTRNTIRNWVALLECSAPVQKAVESGTIPAAEAVKLAKLSHDEQKQTLASMQATGATKGKKAREAVDAARKKRAPETIERMRTQAQIAQVVTKLNALLDGEDLDDEFADEARLSTMILGWVLGKTPSTIKNYPAFAKALEP